MWAFALIIPTSANYTAHLDFLERHGVVDLWDGRIRDPWVYEAQRDARRMWWALVLNTIGVTVLIPLNILFGIPLGIAGGFFLTYAQFLGMTYVVDFFHSNRSP